MTQLSFGWANNATGDGAKISVVDFAALLASLGSGRGPGIVWGLLSNLRPSVSGAHVLVEAGWAVGKTGHIYRNDAQWDSGSLTPSTGTTGHRLVLREDLTAQTVRFYDISSADGTSTIPAATSEDITVCTFTVTTGGSITLTDCRELRVGSELVRYKTATQTKSASTTLEDVVAADDDGLFSIPLVEGSVWEVELALNLTFSNTGGAKFQMAGPASGSPSIALYGTRWQGSFSSLPAGNPVPAAASIAAFASDSISFAAQAAASGSTQYPNDAGTVPVTLAGRIVCGTVAGKAVLSFAQQNANTSTTLTLGTVMRARRIA